jgi:hypothetical protein
MPRRFRTHYTVDEARALLPQVRHWLVRVVQARDRLEKVDQRLESMRGQHADLGGAQVNDWVRLLADLKRSLLEFHQRDIQLKDLDRGLIDFPAIRDGKEVFLCWEQGEEDIEFWHDLDAGYGGREKL